MLAAGKPNAQLLQSVGNHLGILLIIADHLMDLLLPLIGEHRRGALLDNIGYAVKLSSLAPQPHFVQLYAVGLQIKRNHSVAAAGSCEPGGL